MKKLLWALLFLIPVIGMAFNVKKISTEHLIEGKWEVLVKDTATNVSVDISDSLIVINYPDQIKKFNVVYKSVETPTGSGVITIYKTHDCLIKHVKLFNGTDILYIDYSYKRITLM